MNNDISKSIRVGTVDFFGIMIPGILIITMCTIGFVLPLVSVIMDMSQTEMVEVTIDTNGVLLTIFLLVIFSYVLGYILRLSSPDQLDRKSAVKVIWGECKKNSQATIPLTTLEWIASRKNILHAIQTWVRAFINKRQIMDEWIKKDGWPFNPGNPKDKYPYLNFQTYLEKRGHRELVKDLITWDKESDNKIEGQIFSAGPQQKPSASQKSSLKTQRSKSNVNKMKMMIRLYCPDLSALVESKEAHIRLMAGSWVAFKFSQWPIWIALIILGVVGFARQWIESVLPVHFLGHNYPVYMFINVNLLLIIYFCNQRIEKLFHYRRVSELFHIVQAAHFAEKIKQQIHTRKSSSSTPSL